MNLKGQEGMHKMKVIIVEGYKVEIEKIDNAYSFTVPDLPGIVGKVKEEKEVLQEIRRLMGRYFIELTTKRPPISNQIGNQKPKKIKKNH